MNEFPKVSVIIPTFNHGHYIKKAIDSLLNQTYKDFETIIIDDGSRDNTKDIVASYGNVVRYIYQENKGLPHARNTGIAAARGIYVAFLDADDYFEEKNLEKKVSFLETHSNIDWVFSDWDYIDEDGNFIERGSIKWHYSEKVFGDKLFEELVMHRNFISPCTVIIKKSTLKAVEYFDTDVICQEDWDLWLRLSLNHPSHFINEVLVHVVVHPDSLSKNFSKWAYGNYLIVEKLSHIIPQSFPDRNKVIVRLQADKYTFLARDFIQKGEMAKAVITLLRSIHKLPFQKKVYWLLLSTIIEGIRKRFKAILIR